MEAAIILLAVGLVLLGGSAFAAFAWAARDGQFERLESSAEVIFDESEPIGEGTDFFPDEAGRRARARAGK